MSDQLSLKYPGPVVIGGTGGSGTRVLHDLVSQAGFFMGTRLNGSNDALDFTGFLDIYVDLVLEVAGSPAIEFEQMPRELSRGAQTDFQESAERFLRDKPISANYWGWKNPRSMFVLPVIQSVFPTFRFVHLIRDGRDMALSANQNQLRKHGLAILADGSDDLGPVRSAQFWSKANLDVALWCSKSLGARYLRVRFEDLCANPAEVVRQLEDFLFVSDDKRVSAERLLRQVDLRAIKKPASLGRWKSESAETISELERHLMPALLEFGYVAPVDRAS